MEETAKQDFRASKSSLMPKQRLPSRASDSVEPLSGYPGDRKSTWPASNNVPSDSHQVLAMLTDLLKTLMITPGLTEQ